MPTKTHFRGLDQFIASHPRCWEPVTKSDTNYLRGNAADNEAAMVLMSYGGGTITYRDVRSDELGQNKVIKLQPGGFVAGEFVRVMSTGTDATDIYAGFMTYAS